MDFWDVAKLMWRRWHLTVPLVLLVAAAGIWTGVSVAPDYQVTGHLAMVEPTTPPPEEDEPARAVNPWSTEALAEAAAIRLEGKALADQMAAEGYEGSWSLGVTGNQPWLRLEVIGPSPEEAQATVERLREIIEDEVRARQDDYNLPPDEQITTVWFAEGETVETISQRLRRAVVAVVGAGLVLATGIVIAFDAIMRRREQQRVPAAPDDTPRPRYQFGAEVPSRAPVTSAAGAGGHTPRTNGAADPAAGAEADQPAASPVLQAVRVTGTPDRPDPYPDHSDPYPERHSDPYPDRYPDQYPERPDQYRDRPDHRADHRWDRPGEPPPEAGPPSSVADDSTIVLPMSNYPRAGWPTDPRDRGPDETGRSG